MDNLLKSKTRLSFIQIIFENLYDYGFRKFCIIVSSNYKSVIKNHLTHDLSFIKLLSKRNHYHDKRFGKTLSRLSKKIEKCEVHWINQDTPMGFGHALLSAKKFSPLKVTIPQASCPLCCKACNPNAVRAAASLF